VSLGWQWDAQAPGQLRFFAPIAKENGKTITGLLRGDLMLSEVMPEIPLGHLMEGHLGGVEYPVAAMKDPRNVLTVRNSREGQRTVIPHAEWQFRAHGQWQTRPFRPVYSFERGLPARKDLRIRLCCRRPGRAGGGFAAIRDFASYAKHDANAITPAERVYGEAFRRMGAFCATFSTRASMRMKKEEWRWTVFLPT